MARHNLVATRFGGGCGTVFELSPNSDGTWSESVIYGFCSQLVGNECVDGRNPTAGLTIDSQGNLYGTTNLGGDAPQCPQGGGCGTVFELSPPLVPGGSWTESVLHSFCSNFVNEICVDGLQPSGQVTMDAAGDIYSTATGGGNAGDGGVVFELSPQSSGWMYTAIYTFCSNRLGRACLDGATPQAGVTFDAFGNLFGTTNTGGAKYGAGTVFELSPYAGGWTESVLLVYRAPFSTGSYPASAVSFDAKGNLYGTASMGGPENAGSVFRLTPKYIPAAFVFDGANGSRPMAGVLVDSRTTTIYGTTYEAAVNGLEVGNLFKIGPGGKETVLYSFCQQSNCTDGAGPAAPLVSHAGSIYGTAQGGGANALGVVFELTP